MDIDLDSRLQNEPLREQKIVAGLELGGEMALVENWGNTMWGTGETQFNRNRLGSEPNRRVARFSALELVALPSARRTSAVVVCGI